MRQAQSAAAASVTSRNGVDICVLPDRESILGCRNVPAQLSLSFVYISCVALYIATANDSFNVKLDSVLHATSFKATLFSSLAGTHTVKTNAGSTRSSGHEDGFRCQKSPLQRLALVFQLAQRFRTHNLRGLPSAWILVDCSVATLIPAITVCVRCRAIRPVM